MKSVKSVIIQIIISSGFCILLGSQSTASEVSYSEVFAAGDVLSADKINTTLSDIKLAVDDNASKKSIAEFTQMGAFSAVLLKTTNILTTVSSVTINAPSSGRVLLSFVATARLIHPSIDSNLINQASRIDYTIVVDETDPNIPFSRQLVTVPVGYAAGNVDLSMSSIRTFRVDSQGLYTFYARAVVSNQPSLGGQNFHAVMNPTMQAVFVPD